MNPPESPNSLFARVRVVLVETSHPGNIGAVARAMKTMGFSNLVLVRPRFAEATRHEEALAFASGALDVLENARVVQDFDAAIAGCNFAAALSARLREFSPPLLTPRALAAQLVTQIAATSDLRAALVFGSERYGLPNEVIEKCNALINIPANPVYSSLNLAQAVQVLMYELRMAATEGAVAPVPEIGFRGEAADLAQVEGMYAHLEQALTAIDFLDPANPRKLMPRLKRLFARTGLEKEEVNILRGIATHILINQQRQD